MVLPGGAGGPVVVACRDACVRASRAMDVLELVLVLLDTFLDSGGADGGAVCHAHAVASSDKLASVLAHEVIVFEVKLALGFVEDGRHG